MAVATKAEVLTCKHLIGGKWQDSADGKTFESINPATGETLAVCAAGGPREVNQAVESAVRAYDKWRLTPAPRRAEILFRLAETLIARKEDLAVLMAQEMGKVLKETRGDVQEAIDMAYYMAGEGRRLFGQTVPAELPNKFAMSVRDPVGVCALITPWNFPMAIPSWKILPALIAGNTVVFKPASDTPILAWKFVQILQECGLPEGVVNFVMGSGSGVGAPLAEHGDVKVVSFTGSTSVGAALSDACSRPGKKISLELGGKNAILVMDDADVDLAIEGIVWSAFGTSGQRCTAASRVIVDNTLVDEVTEKIVARAKALRLGDPTDPKTEMGPLVNYDRVGAVHEYTEIGKEEGAELLCGGEAARDGDLSRGAFYKPTVFGNVKPHMRIAQEEIFGPTTAIIGVDGLDEAVRVNNETAFGLSSSIYTRDVNRAFRAVRDITTGIVYVNAGTIGAEVHLPFGGTRGTGNGHREAGQAAFETFTEWKSIYVDFSGKLQRAQIDTE